MKACDCAAVEGIKTTTTAAAAAATFRLQLIQRLRQRLPRRRSSCPDVCGDPEVRGRVPRADADRLTGGIRWTRSAAGAAAPAPPRSVRHADIDARVSSLSCRLTSSQIKRRRARVFASGGDPAADRCSRRAQTNIRPRSTA